MPSNPCALPPGRAYEVEHHLPVIPPGLFGPWRATGRWPAGVQKGLDETRDCPWVPHMAQVRERAVVSSGVLYRLEEPVLGALPWGWYRYLLPVEDRQAPPEEDRTTPEQEAPPAPEDTLVVYRDVSPRAVAVVDLGPVQTATPWQPAPQVECVHPVPTLDLLLPWPWQDWGNQQVDGEAVRVLPGSLGRVCWRLPGSDHPLFSTGVLWHRVDPALLSELGRRFYGGRPGTVGGPGTYHAAWTDTMEQLFTLSPQAAVRDYVVSHMQCLSPLHYPGSLAPVRWDWKHGGPSPAQPPAPWQCDTFRVFSPDGRTASGNAFWLRGHLFDDEGRRLDEQAPEWPVGPGQLNGPPAGAFHAL